MFRMIAGVSALLLTCSFLSLGFSALFLWLLGWLGFSALSQGWGGLLAFLLAFLWQGVVLSSCALRGLADELRLGSAVGCLEAIAQRAEEESINRKS